MSEPADSLSEALRSLREQYGHQSVVRGVPAQLLARLAPASDPLSPWWPGRLPDGPRVIELAGPRSCGKLSLTLLWLAALRRGGLIAVVDADGSFYPPAAAAAGLDLEHLVVVHPTGQKEAVDVATMPAGCSGFDAILWPLNRKTRPNSAASMKLAMAAQRSHTSILTLMERPARTDWSGFASADVRLSVSRHQWQWVDRELVGVDLDVACDRVRGIPASDWSFTLGQSDDGDLRIEASGARAGTVAAEETTVRVAV
jgi:hypothetical protein